MLSLPASREIWIVLLYVAAVIVGARVVESMARMHFERARQYAERDFEYDPIDDRYRCPEGALLPLRRMDREKRLAIYGAPASRCRDCRLKMSCAPYDDGRQILPIARELGGDRRRQFSPAPFAPHVRRRGRSLRRGIDAESLGQRGTGLLLLALIASLASLLRDWSRGILPPRC